MGLVAKTIPGLYNGVSQQPPALRLDTQCELQENCLSGLVDGLVKRPNTEHVATLSSSNAGLSAFLHTINRDVTERYKVIITDDETDPVEVYTLDGTECTVNYNNTDTKAYVTTSDPKDSLRTVTVADHTIIVNQNKTPAMEAATGSLPDPKALGYIKKGLPEIKYTITVYDSSGTEEASASHTTAAPSSSGVTTSKTDDIVSELVTSLDSSLGSNWSVSGLGSVVEIENTAGNDFSIECTDSYGDTATIAINGSVQKFTDLPPTAPDGYHIVVNGDDDDSFDNFYVEYKSDENIWEETVALTDEADNMLENSMDATTLPHRLVRTDVNEFTLKQIAWEDREIGDLNSAPEPSFIGEPIKDVFFFKNRLGFLSGENIIMSRASEYFNLFPSTATDVLDSDPIDNAVSSKKVAKLLFAIPFTSSLLLFSDQQQFTANSSQGLLTPSTISIDSSTYFETSTDCQPIGAGPNLYFVVPRGDYSSIREYFVQPNAVTNDADEVTAHVPRYLPKGITKLASSSAEDVIFALSEEDPSTVYVYKYYWDGKEKVQSSWSKWVFEDDEILDIEILDNYLYMITKQGTETLLVRIDLDASIPTDSLNFRVHLDKLVEVTGSYDSGTETTTFTLPYNDVSEEFEVVNSDTGNILSNVSKTATDTVEVDGDFTETSYYIGKLFTQKYTFSKFYLKNDQGVANIQGKLKIKTLTLSFSATGLFDIVVNTTGREEQRETFTGVIIGSSIIGEPARVSGEKTFSIRGDNNETTISIESHSYLPTKFQIAAYEAEYATRT